MTRKELIDAIIAIEWPMFSSVNNAGGKALCQMRPDIFRIMRSSQYNGWSEDLLQSWLTDLENAQNEGRNLASEKYARMMEFTHPEEYAQLAHLLPSVEETTAKKIDEIVKINLSWKDELDNKYPHLSSRGRNAREDKLNSTPSIKTYLQAELQTYSPATIDLYHQETLKRQQEGRSEAEENLLSQIRQYGFGDLASAERRFAEKDAKNE